MSTTHWLESAKALLEEAVAQGEEAILPHLIVRGSDLTSLMLICGDARFLASLGLIVVAGFEADELVLVADAYGSHSPTNPEGAAWGKGEMQARAKEPAVAELLFEQVVMLRAYKGLDDVAVRALRYRRTDEGLAWDEEVPEIEAKGFLAERLLAAVNQEPILNYGAKLLGLSREQFEAKIHLTASEMRLHSRIACVRFLMDKARQADQPVAVIWARKPRMRPRSRLSRSGASASWMSALDEVPSRGIEPAHLRRHPFPGWLDRTLLRPRNHYRLPAPPCHRGRGRELYQRG